MNTYLAETIIELAKFDQESRFLENTDPLVKKLLVYSMDSAHSHRIRTWIAEYGYPSKEMIGEEALHWFWLLVQHQDYDLPLMEECLKNCIFSPEDTAYLTDRIQTTKKLPQIYGTQFHKVDGVRVIYPIENLENVDTLRSEMGMSSLETYINSQE